MLWYGTAAAVTYWAADFSYLALKVQAVSDFYYFRLAPARLIDASMAKKPGLYFAPPLFRNADTRSTSTARLPQLRQADRIT